MAKNKKRNPYNWLDKIKWLRKIKKDRSFFKHVPESPKTEAMCLAALNETTRTNKYVPENLKVKLIPIFSIRLTDDEINIINAWAKDLCDSNKVEIIEIDETIWKNGKKCLIDSFTQSKLKNISCIADSFLDIESVEFSEKNTKAILNYAGGRGPLSDFGWAASFSKENSIWKQIDTEFL